MTTTSTATETTKPDRAEANRRNARKSTGPRTAEGKDRSRFNAVKHGLTAKTLVLPGEDADALQLRLDGWSESLKPTNDLEQYLVERAVRVSWQLDRADRAEVARIQARIRDDEFRDAYSQVSVDVVALGRRLFWDRRGPLELYPHFPLKDQLLAHKQPRTSFSGLAEDPDDPQRLLIQLERSAAGCLWLLQQWAELREILDQDLLWQPIDRFKAIRLLGRQQTDAADYSDVTTIYLACWIMHPQVKEIDPFQDVYNELLAGEAVQFRQRLADRVVEDYIPEDSDEAKAKLLAIVTRAVDRLKILWKDHEDRAEAEDADRSARLAFDDSDEGERLRRFQIACGRSLNRGLDMLLKLRKAEEKRHPEPIPTAPVLPEASLPIDEPHARGIIEKSGRSSPAEADPPEPITTMIPAARSDPSDAEPSLIVGWVKPTDQTDQNDGFHPPYKTELGPTRADCPRQPNRTEYPAARPPLPPPRIETRETNPPRHHPSGPHSSRRRTTTRETRETNPPPGAPIPRKGPGTDPRWTPSRRDRESRRSLRRLASAFPRFGRGHRNGWLGTKTAQPASPQECRRPNPLRRIAPASLPMCPMLARKPRRMPTHLPSSNRQG